MLCKSASTESSSYYYSTSKLYEKSLDIYKPATGEKLLCEGAFSKPPLVVVLVVGSGWIGHRSFVYSLTSWWNSSGPRTVASLGCTCVCVRHRGAFCVVPRTTAILEFLILLFAALGALTGGRWDAAVGVTAFVAAVIFCLALGGRGSASIEDMWDDVAEALQWIQRNPELLTTNGVHRPSPGLSMRERTSMSSTSASLSRLESLSDSSESDSEAESTPSSPARGASNPKQVLGSMSKHKRFALVFGGYSSGGHVAATLLQQPKLFKKHNLPPPEDLFDGIIMVSGMLGIRQGSVTVQDKCNNNKFITIGTPKGSPRWLTDFVVNTVWGPEAKKLIPSPLTQGNSPRLPHLVLGCRKEVFGLRWLDIFFCGRAFAKCVKAVTGMEANYVEVESDHWNVLNSRALREALLTELPKLVAQN